MPCLCDEYENYDYEDVNKNKEKLERALCRAQTIIAAILHLNLIDQNSHQKLFNAATKERKFLISHKKKEHQKDIDTINDEYKKLLARENKIMDLEGVPSNQLLKQKQKMLDELTKCRQKTGEQLVEEATSVFDEHKGDK